MTQSGTPCIVGYSGVRSAAGQELFIERFRRTDPARRLAEQAVRIADFARRNTWTQRVTGPENVGDGLRPLRNPRRERQRSR